MTQNIHGKNLDDVLSDKKIPIRISCITSSGYPLVLSLWYAVLDNKIYCATQKNSKIILHLRKNPSCGFEIAADAPPYRGIRGYGDVEILDQQGSAILDILIDKYLGHQESNLSKLLRKNSSSEVAIKITPKNIVNYDYSNRMKNVTLRKNGEMMKDDACPTCGSKKFEIIENKSFDCLNTFQLQCHNCKKF